MNIAVLLGQADNFFEANIALGVGRPGGFVRIRLTQLILLIGSLARRASTCQTHTAHAAWRESRRPAPQTGRAPPRTPGRSTTTFRGETWLSTAA